MDALLEELSDWPVDNVAAHIIGAETSTFGDVNTLGDMEAQFHLASVSKLISAYAVLIAVEEGAFELDEPVDGSLVPGWDTAPTPRELLSHASGVDFRERTQKRPSRSQRLYSSAGFDILADHITCLLYTSPSPRD